MWGSLLGTGRLALLLAFTTLYVAAFHVPHSSLFLYWPVALLVAGGILCCRPAPDHPFVG